MDAHLLQVIQLLDVGRLRTGSALEHVAKAVAQHSALGGRQAGVFQQLYGHARKIGKSRASSAPTGVDVNIIMYGSCSSLYAEAFRFPAQLLVVLGRWGAPRQRTVCSTWEGYG
jgi:hypothetical protein